MIGRGKPGRVRLYYLDPEGHKRVYAPRPKESGRTRERPANAPTAACHQRRLPIQSKLVQDGHHRAP